MTGAGVRKRAFVESSILRIVGLPKNTTLALKASDPEVSDNNSLRSQREKHCA
jgi:hypothetical protein